MQGYWKQYADILFANQSEWEYSEGSERTALFNKYFNEATGGNGDLSKFQEDISSTAVSKKIKFDMGIARKVDIDGAPSLYVDGQKIEWSMDSSATINGHTISWEKVTSEEGMITLFGKIANAMLSE